MTKKDYELIAQAIEAAYHNYTSDHDTLARVAGLIADQLFFDNPKFDRARFLNACGVAQ